MKRPFPKVAHLLPFSAPIFVAAVVLVLLLFVAEFGDGNVIGSAGQHRQRRPRRAAAAVLGGEPPPWDDRTHAALGFLDPTDPSAAAAAAAAVAVQCSSSSVSDSDICESPRERSLPKQQPKKKQQQQQSVGQTIWPPWPFSVLRLRQSASAVATIGDDAAASSRTVATASAALWTWTKSTARFSLRQSQDIGSQLWFHAPPAFPPLLLYAIFPRRHAAAVTPTTTIQTNAVASLWSQTGSRIRIPAWSDPLLRTALVGALGLAMLSYLHDTVHRRHCLTLLPLNLANYNNFNTNRQRRGCPPPPSYSLRSWDIQRPELPPFLPESVAIPPDNDNVDNERGVALDSSQSHAIAGDDAGTAATQERKKTRWNLLARRRSNAVSKPTPRLFRRLPSLVQWQRRHYRRHAERHNARRLAVYDELLTWQRFRCGNNNNHSNDDNKDTSHQRQQSLALQKQKNVGMNIFQWMRKNALLAIQPEISGDPLGYALVTGASAGIGRALAVELARWNVPLILVARDVNALTDLAVDLEACYGIDCCVLSADLSTPTMAEQIYETVTQAGLQVDILVNNAGISAHGESLNLSLNDVKNMIQVNAFSVAELTHFFGRDMKERRRGRILFVSSICGSVSGIASVAIYSATKAFENSFGVSIGKELEPYGVGVTCLIPGAVRGTEFRSNSQSQDALCWKIPFYAKTTSSVAASGIRAMLRGNTEVMPGVLNRIFLKVCKPVLPQRLHNLVAEVMWNPVELPFKKKSTVENKAFEELPTISNVSSVIPTKRLSATRPQSFSVNLCPRTLFILEKVEPNVEAVAANLSFGELDSVDAICANEESPEKESEMKSLPDEGLMSAASETQSSPSCPGNATMEHENQVTPSTPDPTVEHKKRIAPSTNAPTAKQPSKTDSKSRTEIDLLLEQYKRNRIFSVEPFNERNYFDDPLDFRLCPSIQEMNGSS